MIKEIKSFLYARMNLDAGDHYLKPTDHRKIFNSMLSATRDAGLGYLIKVGGTTNVFTLAVNAGFTLPAGTFVCNGVCDDIQRKTIIYCLRDTVGHQVAGSTIYNHCILRMFTDSYKLEFIINSLHILNFKKGFSIFANVVEDLYSFTDGYEGTPFVDYNPPREINTVMATAYTNFGVGGRMIYKGMIVGYQYGSEPRRAYRYINDTPSLDYDQPPFLIGTTTLNSAYWELASNHIYGGIDFQTLDAIIYPPKFKPTAHYINDSNVKTNRLRNILWQIKYRYVTVNNQKSAWSDPSDIPIPNVLESVAGFYDDTHGMMDNGITVALQTGVPEVSRIDVAVREGNVGDWRLVKRLYKYDEDGKTVITSSSSYGYTFYNNEASEGLDQDDTNRIQDYVPQVASVQEIIEKTRRIYGDYTEGFGHTDIDVGLEVIKDRVEPISGFNYNFRTGSSSDAYPMYAKQIDWRNMNYPTYQYDHLAYSCLVARFWNIPILAGYTYTLSVIAKYDSGSGIIPYQYTTSQDPMDPGYPPEFVDDYTVATSIVTLTDTDNMYTLLNKLAAGLRADAFSGNYSCLAFTSKAYDFWRNDIWGNWTDQGTLNNQYHLEWDTEIGIVLQGGGILGVDMGNCRITLDVVKTTKYDTFLSGDTKRFALVYKDRGKRIDAANESEKSSLYIPFQTEGNNAVPIGSQPLIWRNKIGWTINHKPPMFADTYRWALAYNPPYQCYVPLIKIGTSTTLNNLPGIIQMTGSSYLALEVIENFAVMRETFTSFNLDTYSWAKGDRVRFVLKSHQMNPVTKIYVTLPTFLDFEIVSFIPAYGKYLMTDGGANHIVDKDGNWQRDPSLYVLIIPTFDYVSAGIDPLKLASDNVIVQLYRPAKTVENPLYYEFGEEMAILNPHTSSRCHQGGQLTDSASVLYQRNQTATQPAKGIFPYGDAYIIARFMANNSFSCVFPCESTSFSDWYDSNSVSIGLPNIANRDAKRKRYISKLIYSGLYIPNTNVNELSRFMSTDSFELPIKFGSIRYIKEIGYTLKILQDNKPSSLFIGRAGVTQPDANSTDILTSTKTVLGTLITPNSNLGTIHSTSAYRFENDLYYYDGLSGAIIRDAGNGAMSLSLIYGIDDYIKKKSILFQSHGWENIDVFTCYDQTNHLVWFTFIDNYDTSQSFTIAFHHSDRQEEEGFISFYDFTPEFFGASKVVFTSWKEGALWLHNTGVKGKVYGVDLVPSVETVFNLKSEITKLAKSIAIRTNSLWKADTIGDVYAQPNLQYPRGQSSMIKAWEVIQGVQRAPLGRNMITHQVQPTTGDFVEGDELRTECLELKIRNDNTDNPNLVLFDMELQWNESKPN
jgi:hypothetical protein